MDAAERKQMTVYGIIEATEEFIRNCQYSNCVDTRWLCYQMTKNLDVMRQVRNGKLEPETKALVNTFRAQELQIEIERRRRDLENLERDLKKVTAA